METKVEIVCDEVISFDTRYIIHDSLTRKRIVGNVLELYFKDFTPDRRALKEILKFVKIDGRPGVFIIRDDGYSRRFIVAFG